MTKSASKVMSSAAWPPAAGLPATAPAERSNSAPLLQRAKVIPAFTFEPFQPFVMVPLGRLFSGFSVVSAGGVNLTYRRSCASALRSPSLLRNVEMQGLSGGLQSAGIGSATLTKLYRPGPVPKNCGFAATRTRRASWEGRRTNGRVRPIPLLPAHPPPG